MLNKIEIKVIGLKNKFDVVSETVKTRKTDFNSVVIAYDKDVTFDIDNLTIYCLNGFDYFDILEDLKC